MKIGNLLKIYTLIMLMIAIASCSKDPTRKLPARNVDNFRVEKDSVNSPKDELATYQRTAAMNCNDAYYKESFGNSNEINHNFTVKPSYSFFAEIMGSQFENDYKEVIQNLTSSLEAVSYLTYNSGFVALSHPTDSAFNFALNLPLYGNIGGTDLFSFENEQGKPVFKSLPNGINSEFWDSHPFSGVDSQCNVILVWASDRNSPYSTTIDLKNNAIKRGNSDLFYAFRKNGKWGSAKHFEFSTKVNTDVFNEISPFIACLNIAPKLLFSSNRSGDYDIYAANLNIDFQNENISVIGEPEILPKGSETDKEKYFVNTSSNEFFPYIATPYANNSNLKSLFVSSNRNRKGIPSGRNNDTLIINKGNYDIYSFDYEMECVMPQKPEPIPPKAILNVNLIDMKNRNRKIVQPVIKLVEEKTGEFVLANSDSKTFTLEYGKKYHLLGGSLQNSLYCEEKGDSLLQYYKARRITKLPPIIKKKETKIKYDTVENAKKIVVFDTNLVKELYPISEMQNVQPVQDFKTTINNVAETRNEFIKDVSFKNCAVPCDSASQKLLKSTAKPNEKALSDKQNGYVEVTKLVVTKREWFEGGKIVKKERTEIAWDTTANFDTTMISAIGAVAKSELTHFNTIEILDNNRDTTIDDIVELLPVYFVKPPCSCEFTEIEHKYAKNVPYFQTAFWKVNTTEGYKQHLSDFQKGNYLERAGYIELHPKHRNYGLGNPTERDRRKKMYEDYAEAVDRNLMIMRDEIVNRFIPALESLDSLAPGTKILIKLEAYSDERKADKCNYIGTSIDYIQGKKEQSGNIILQKESVPNGASLSSDNENLSKLRVFYGFHELFNRLKQNSSFANYLRRGEVFYPTMNFTSEADMYKQMEKSRIIILAEGKYYDKVYSDNTEEYDPVRRINLYIDLIKYNNGRVVITPCCNPNINCGE